MSDTNVRPGRAAVGGRNRQSIVNRYQLAFRLVLLGAVFSLPISRVAAQQPVERTAEPQDQPISATEDFAPTPGKVNINPIARDEEIRKRLQSVLEATGWFTEPQVRVKEGVVFLQGLVESAELKKWASDLARNTQDVVAVANRMQVAEPSAWDFRPPSVPT